MAASLTPLQAAMSSFNRPAIAPAAGSTSPAISSLSSALRSRPLRPTRSLALYTGLTQPSCLWGAPAVSVAAEPSGLHPASQQLQLCGRNSWQACTLSNPLLVQRRGVARRFHPGPMRCLSPNASTGGTSSPVSSPADAAHNYSPDSASPATASSSSSARAAPASNFPAATAANGDVLAASALVAAQRRRVRMHQKEPGGMIVLLDELEEEAELQLSLTVPLTEEVIVVHPVGPFCMTASVNPTVALVDLISSTVVRQMTQSWSAAHPAAGRPSPLPAVLPANSPPLAPAAAEPWTAIKIGRLLGAVAVGLTVYTLVPCPASLSTQSWTLFSIFCSTVSGLVLEPLPVGAWALCCLCALLVSGAATFQTAMSGIANESIWLIVIAFFFAKSFETSGLGERIANIFVSTMGHSSLGLAYGLTFAEALMAPALPSSTARAGGIFMPIIKSLAHAAGSTADGNPERLGAFLVHCQCQASSQSAALFMTGAAQNILAMSIAVQMGVVVPDAWMTWFKGAVVPASVGLLMVPGLVFLMAPPEMKQSPEAPKAAAARLVEMGSPSRKECITLCVLLVAVAMWVFGSALGLPAVAAAMVALCALLCTGVLSWQSCLENTAAWDTLVWFAVLMSMCSALSEGGVIAAFASAAQSAMSAAQLHWGAAFAALHVSFFMTHYLFASQVGHVGALYGAFLAMMLAAGVPSTLAALSLGYNANLFGTITHYASGPAAVYYSSGYQKMGEVLKLGAVLGARSLLTWGVVGMAWWKVLGWW